MRTEGHRNEQGTVSSNLAILTEGHENNYANWRRSSNMRQTEGLLRNESGSLKRDNTLMTDGSTRKSGSLNSINATTRERHKRPSGTLSSINATTREWQKPSLRSLNRSDAIVRPWPENKEDGPSIAWGKGGPKNGGGPPRPRHGEKRTTKKRED